MAGDRSGSGESRRQFEEEVLPTELDYVEHRRRSVGDDRQSLRDPRHATVDNDLVGVALSGGGIRSASFALGVLQALGGDRFRRVDYMSTVSGGGFIGSSITALMANAFFRTGRAELPFPGTSPEPAALCHLRNNSDYLKPSGPRDLLRLVAVLLRGIILNSLALFPFLLLTCLLVLLVYGQQLSDRARFDDQVRRVDALLERHLGDRLERQREVEPLLAVLESQALLRIDEGKTRGDVVSHLRSELSFEHDSLDRDDLITGGGGAETPYRLTPAATREDLARALLHGDVLQRYEVIEEIDLLARALEQDGYRHCVEHDDEAPGGVGKAASCEPDGDYFGGGVTETDYGYDHLEALVDAAAERDLFRPATEPGNLRDFLDSRWDSRLKVVLQALYNGEFFDETVLARLVDDALDRTAFYAYGWYRARVGQAFPDGWTHAGTFSGLPLFEAIQEELHQLGDAFSSGCLATAKSGRPPCLRPETTPDDVLRLLAFEQLLGAQAPEARWPDLKTWAGSLEPERIDVLLELFYFSEYLDESWVLQALRDSATDPEWRLLAEDLDERLDPLVDDGRDDSELLPDRLVLDREVVCRDLAEILRAKDLVSSLDCPELAADLKERAAWLELLWHRLDRGWVAHRLYVYRYGWHRREIGVALPNGWCAGAAAGRSDAGCPEVSNAAWADLARALRDPSRWDPGRLTFPLTGFVARAALGWVLAAPVLLLLAGAIYRRRQRAIGGAPDPFSTLRSSDRSLVWRKIYDQSFGFLLATVLGMVLFELLPYTVHYFHHLSLAGRSWHALAVAGASLLVTGLSGPALLFLKRFGRRLSLGLLAVAGPLLLLIVFAAVMELVVYAPPPQVDRVLGLFAEAGISSPTGGAPTLWFDEAGQRRLDPTAAWILFVLVSLVSLGLARLIDINATSLHGYYRDRIACAFMVGLDTEGDIEPEEDLPLHQMCPDGSGAPYHLLNVALSLPGSRDRSLRGRGADFFFFSRDHIGGPRTGYCRTTDMARIFPLAHLGSAMAVSGAAISPAMGRYKAGPLAVLLGLLNARLGLWVPHPAGVRSAVRGGQVARAWHRFRAATPATLLLRELAGLAHDRGPVVNVSDGGHIENTGALELLRRRCREIIVVDGEADPTMSFGGFALLQRIARIDLGIEIEIDIDALRPDERGLSTSRSAVGVIRYPAAGGPGEKSTAEEIGRLLYVKLAVTGKEGETVAEYRARYPDFPHQSTGDQSFDEGQFEAYRRLGQLAGRDAFTCTEHRAR